jgi:hypothetical protein
MRSLASSIERMKNVAIHSLVQEANLSFSFFDGGHCHRAHRAPNPRDGRTNSGRAR